MAQDWSHAPAPTLKGKGAIITGIVLLVLGLFAVIAGIVGSASAVSSLVSGFSSPQPTPAHITLKLDGGTTYAVYEESGGGSGTTGDPFQTVVGPQDVTITGPGGSVPFTGAGSSVQTYKTSSTTFVESGTFDPPTTGTYTVDVTTTPSVQVVVAPSFTSFGRVAGWIGLIGLGVLLGLVGLITLIVGLVRRSSSKKAVAAATAYGAGAAYAANPYGAPAYGTPQYGAPQYAAPAAGSP